jgi:hypothetical protein
MERSAIRVFRRQQSSPGFRCAPCYFLWYNFPTLGEDAMRSRSILAALMTVYSVSAFAADPVFIDPEITQFRFTKETKSTGKFCNLIVSAIKVPGSGSLNAVVWRRGPSENSMVFGYEIEAFESTFQYGIPSKPQALEVRHGSISSNLFSSDGSVDRLQAKGALYAVRAPALEKFVATMLRGFYFVNAEVVDGRSLTYVIREDATLSSAGEQWLKCTIEIAK